MCEILVKAVSISNADPEKDKRGCYKKGYPVVVKPDGWEWGNLETLPTFIIIKCPEISVAAAETYMQQWVRQIDYEVVAHQLSTDGYRIRVYATNKNVSGEVSCTIQKRIDGNSIKEFEVARYSFDSNSSHFGITQIYLVPEESFNGYDEMCIFLKIYCYALLGQKFCWSNDIRNI